MTADRVELRGRAFGFNTASGMRSHVTRILVKTIVAPPLTFQYRKRYEITCDDESAKMQQRGWRSFNTASGMRSHVTVPMSRIATMSMPVSIPQAV